MAGSVIVARGSVVSMSTVVFDGFVEKIRLGFGSESEGVLKQVFEPMDEGAMAFISAMDLSPEDFRVFAKAVKAAAEGARVDDDFSVHEQRWSELLSLVSSDARMFRN